MAETAGLDGANRHNEVLSGTSKPRAAASRLVAYLCPYLGGQFQFICVKDRSARRQALSHAVARGLEAKRKAQQISGHNFRVVSAKDPGRLAGKRKRGRSAIASPCRAVPTNHPNGPGPFQMLAAESPRLLAWLAGKAQQTAEPDITVSDELVLRHFRSVLRKGLDDDALLSAVMLTFAFAAGAGSIDKECLGYQSEVLRSVRQRMSVPNVATSEPTLGAILLLAGIEVCTSLSLFCCKN